MNICLVGDLDPHPEQNLGGPQFVTYNLANALSKSHELSPYDNGKERFTNEIPDE